MRFLLSLSILYSICSFSQSNSYSLKCFENKTLYDNITRNNIIGYKILRIEKEIFGDLGLEKKLDSILCRSINSILGLKLMDTADEEDKALAIFENIGNILRESGYRHRYTYPNTFSEFLMSEERGFDCDTGSYIYLSIGDILNLPISMVEVEADGGNLFSDHNFVRWTLGNGKKIDWDTNGEYQRMDDKENGLYGFAWSDKELLGYIHYLRGIEWNKRGQYDKAISDYETSINKFPKWMKARNNLAWLLSTVEKVQKYGRQREAYDLANKVIKTSPTANNLDTYACACAIIGKYDEAIEVQTKIVEQSNSGDFMRRLKKFEAGENCIGEE